jgi:nucleoside-diphosphate-sugar epimerase
MEVGMSFLDKPILVSGATGFIGGRVCERLVQAGARDVRALVHDVPHAARIARLPIQLVTGDLLNAQSTHAITGGAKLVIHLGLGYGRAIVKGTTNLLDAAQANGAERFVHISTTAVYGHKPREGCETEDAPMRRVGDAYCDNKVSAEHVVQKYSKRGLPTITLRPAIVCGPYSRWSTSLIDNLQKRKVTLIDGGQGICNTTYVDNLVDAIFLALENDRAVGETFSITDGEVVTWGDFYDAHASMLDPKPALPDISSETILAYHRKKPGLLKGSFQEGRRILVSPELRALIKRTPLGARLMTWIWYRVESLDDKAKDRFRNRLSRTKLAPPVERDDVPIPDLLSWQIQSGRVVFSISKARKILGYEPRVSFADGIRLTEQWLRFANYV